MQIAAADLATLPLGLARLLKRHQVKALLRHVLSIPVENGQLTEFTSVCCALLVLSHSVGLVLVLQYGKSCVASGRTSCRELVYQIRYTFTCFSNDLGRLNFLDINLGQLRLR